MFEAPFSLDLPSSPTGSCPSPPLSPLSKLLPDQLAANKCAVSSRSSSLKDVQSLESHLLITTLVSQINQQMRSTLNLTDILTFTCQRLVQVLNCRYARILVLESEHQPILRVQGEAGQPDPVGQTISQFAIGEHPHLQQAIAYPGMVWSSTDAGCLDPQPLESQITEHSLLLMAMHCRGQVNGVIELWRSDRSLPWASWEQQILEAVGNQITIAISESRLATETQRQIEQESLLRLITNQIRSSLDLNVILKTIVQEVRQLLRTDRVVIYQFTDGWQGTVVVEDILHPWESVLGTIGQDNCFSAQYARLYQGGRVRAIHDVSHSGLDECHVQFLRKLQVHANLIVPILQGSPESSLPIDAAYPMPSATDNTAKLWGLLIAHECRAPRYWQTWETELLQQLGNQVAIAIQQAELYQWVQTAAAQSQAQTRQLQKTLAELQAAQTQLIQTEKLSSLGQMVAGVAHEINNATNFIHANLPYVQQYADVMEQTLCRYEKHCRTIQQPIVLPDEDVDLDFIRQDFPQLIQSMRSGTNRIKEIVQTLRNFSRVDQAERKAVDLHEGIDSSLVLLKHRLGKEIQVHKDYGSLPLVECHPGQMNQVFLNLLSNALDAIGTSGDLRIRTWQQSSDRIVISIQDTGHGIPQEIQDRIFDPFFTTKSVGQGTGLGLSICHQIVVKGHGGQIHCFSQPNHGTEFQVELPILQTG